jgi:hypothetical protein
VRFLPRHLDNFAVALSSAVGSPPCAAFLFKVVAQDI